MNRVTGNRNINFSKLSLIYLLHFIYIPCYLFIHRNEDVEALGLITFLIIIFSAVMYIYNLAITAICIRIGLKDVLSFLLPVFFLVVLYKPAQLFLEFIDLFGGKEYYYLIGVTLIINFISYLIFKRSVSNLKN